MTIKSFIAELEPFIAYDLFTARQIKFFLKLHEVGGEEDMSAIRKLIPVSRPAMSRIVDALAIRDLIVRKRLNHDRGRVNVVITDKGRALIEAMEASA